MKYKQCPFCEKWVPSKYMRHHKKVCRVRRGLDPKPGTVGEDGEKGFVAKKGESIGELLDRVSASRDKA